MDATTETLLATTIAEHLGTKTPQSIAFINHTLDQALLFDTKQQSYGLGNILKIKEHGVQLRIEEKLERIKHLIATTSNPNEESIEDNYLDIANLAVIALMFRKGEWK